MKAVSIILVIIANVIFICYTLYNKEVNRYKDSEIVISQIATNVPFFNQKTDSWGREFKFVTTNNATACIVSAGSDGKYDNSDDIIATIKKDDCGWYLTISWIFGLDSSTSFHGVHTTICEE